MLVNRGLFRSPPPVAANFEAHVVTYSATPDSVRETTQRLDGEVVASMAALTELRDHANQLDETTIRQIRDGLKEIHARRQRQDFYVAVVGEQKAGKSTLLNAMLGMELLGTAVRECTGTVSFLRRGPRPGYQVSLASGIWEDFCERFPDRHDAFSSQVAEQGEVLARYDVIAKQYPRELTQLEKSLQAWQANHDTLVQKAERAESCVAERREEAARGQQELNAFEAQLRTAERAVPWPYRHAEDWTALPHGLGRVILKRWEQSSWTEHLLQVKAFLEARRNQAALWRQVQDAADAAASIQAERLQLQQTIRQGEQHQQVIQQTLAELPRSHAQAQERRQQLREQWMQHDAERLAGFIHEVKQLTDMNLRGHEVEELHLEVPTDRLPDRIVLIDTPGVNTATEENRERAWRAIRTQADACIVVANLTQPLSESTRQFVRQVREVTPHILLVLTKLDAALESAQLNSDAPEEEVAEAIRVGRTRFAREVGRAEQEILAFAVAARPALKEKVGPAADAFHNELTRLFLVVEAERAIATTAKCAQVIRKTQQATAEKVAELEHAYRHRIDTLRAQQVDDPRALRDRAIITLVPKIRLLACQISTVLRADLKERLTDFHQRVRQPLESAHDSHQLGLAVKALHDQATSELDQIANACQQRIDSQFRPSLDALIHLARQPLWDRYRLSRSISTASPELPAITIPVISAGTRVSLTSVGADLRQQVQRYASRSQALGRVVTKSSTRVFTSSSSAGLTMALFGIAAGAAWGIAHGRKFATLKQECLATIDRFLAELTQAASVEQSNDPVEIEHQLGRQLTSIVDQDLAIFQVWIRTAIHREQQLLADEEKRLVHLSNLRARLKQHDMRLQQLLEEATQVCQGLSHVTEQRAPSPVLKDE